MEFNLFKKFTNSRSSQEIKKKKKIHKKDKQNYIKKEKRK